jgi:alkaline phosphatase D
VDVKGLAPARWYWYRFRAGDAWSPIGRTRTADALGALVGRLRFAIASCQNYEQGYYAAHRHLAQEELDLMLFLGDYVYSDSWGADLVRQHAFRHDARALDEYRIRYAQYRMDEDLQRLHAQVPWAMVWDDGEVDDDWAADQSKDLDPAFVTRRRAALQAYLEHIPMPWILRPNMNDLRIYGELAYGDLARFYLLDDRLYRSYQVCPKSGRGGGNSVYVDECAELARTSRTILGDDQERWLDQALAATRQRWNVIAQQTLVVPADAATGPRAKVATDLWDGYPAARGRLTKSLVTQRVPNPLVVGGDLHATVVGDLHQVPADPSTPVVASAFCCTSITSQGAPRGAYDARLRENPHLKFANSHQRGYTTFDLTPQKCSVAVRVLDSEKRRDSAIATAATFEVAAGNAGVQAG